MEGFPVVFPLEPFLGLYTVRGPWKIETIPSIFPPNCGFTNGDIPKKSQQILENMKWTYLKLTPVKCQSLQHYTVQLASHLSFFLVWKLGPTMQPSPLGSTTFFPGPQQNSLKSWNILKHLESLDWFTQSWFYLNWIWNHATNVIQCCQKPSSPTLNSSCATWEAEVTLCCLARWAIGLEHTGDGPAKSESPVDTC